MNGFGNIKMVVTYAREILKSQSGHFAQIEALIDQAEADIWHHEGIENIYAEFEGFHPRAMKLLHKKKNFLVTAEDEPYFMEVYSIIRYHELQKKTWSDDDERRYLEAAGRRYKATRASAIDLDDELSDEDLVLIGSAHFRKTTSFFGWLFRRNKK